MYLHIGNNNILNKSKIIGIFNYKEIKNSKILEEIKIKCVDESSRESIVLADENKVIKGYISNISAGTLARRANKKQYEER